MHVWVHVLPFIALPFLAWAWHALVPDPWFTGYVLLLPTIYGYLVPGVATGVFHLWRFTGRARVGGILWHHGLMWSTNLSGLALVAFLAAGGQPEGLGPQVGVVVAAAALHGFVLWVHDLGLVAQGMVEIDNPPARAGASPAEIVGFYAPWCFPLIGGGFAVALIIARQWMVVEGRHDWATQLGCYAIGLLALWLPATLMFGWRHGWLHRRSG